MKCWTGDTKSGILRGMSQPKALPDFLPLKQNMVEGLTPNKAVADIVTPNGSIRFSSNGIIIESGGQQIQVGPGGIRISSKFNLTFDVRSSVEMKSGTVIQFASGTSLEMKSGTAIDIRSCSTVDIKGAPVKVNGVPL